MCKKQQVKCTFVQVQGGVNANKIKDLDPDGLQKEPSSAF
jgi:hypothetical protein